MLALKRKPVYNENYCERHLEIEWERLLREGADHLLPLLLGDRPPTQLQPLFEDALYVTWPQAGHAQQGAALGPRVQCLQETSSTQFITWLL